MTPVAEASGLCDELVSVQSDTGEPRLVRASHGVEERPPPGALRHNLVALDDLECDAVRVTDEPLCSHEGKNGSLTPATEGGDRSAWCGHFVPAGRGVRHVS